MGTWPAAGDCTAWMLVNPCVVVRCGSDAVLQNSGLITAKCTLLTKMVVRQCALTYKVVNIAFAFLQLAHLHSWKAANHELQFLFRIGLCPLMFLLSLVFYGEQGELLVAQKTAVSLT